MGTAVGVATTGIGMLGQSQAAGAAADAQDAAAQANIRFLEEAGRGGAQDIESAAQRGIQAGRGALDATQPLQRFADVGTGAFQAAQSNILGGGGSPALQRAIEAGGIGAVSRFSPESQPVRRALQRTARLSGMNAQPAFNQALLGVGQTGLGAVSDISGIQQRQAGVEGDILRQSGAQQASALIGQAPQIATQMQTGQEARLLGELGQQQAVTGAAENIAKLVGRNV